MSVLRRRSKASERQILTPEGIELTFTLAPMGSRAAAFILDWLIIILITVVLGLLVSMAGGAFTAFFILANFVLRTFYFSFFEIVWMGSTPGKRNQKIRVIDGRGGPLSAGAIFARNFTREVEVFLPLVAIFYPEALYPGASGWVALLAVLWCSILMFMPLFNRDRLRVGDLIAGTRVVEMPQSTLLDDLSARRKRSVRYTFTDEQLLHYGNYELQVLEELLRGETVVDSQTFEMVCEKIKRRIGWPRSRWDVQTRVFLEDFYQAQRARLERGLLFGVRHEDKDAARAARQ